MIKILVADDHQIMIDGINSILEDNTNIEVVATARNGIEVIEILKRFEVNVAVLDISMPQLNGLETTKIINEQYPHVKILILTMSKEEEKVLELFEAGALGYILKEQGIKELVNAIEKVNKGEIYFGHNISHVLMRALKLKRNSSNSLDNSTNVKITKREIEVIKLIVDGLTTQEIADKLYIAVTTAETHRRNILTKLNFKNTALLVRYAMENGIIGNDSSN